MTRLITSLTLSISAALAIGCGGDDGGSGGLGCDTAACGGDPVGVWTVVDSCFEGELTIEQCPDLIVKSVDVDQTGTVTIDADMSYTLDLTVSGTASVTFPASCFGGLITDCAQLNDDGTTCTGDASAECDCDITLDEVTDETGTWSTTGNQITLDDGTEPEVSDYCVQGDRAVVSTNMAGINAAMILSR